MKLLLALAGCLALVSCAKDSQPTPTPSANRSAPVVSAISAPDIKPAEKISPDAQKLQEATQRASQRAVAAEERAKNLQEQADRALKSADTAFEKGLVAGSAEAEENRQAMKRLQQASLNNAELAAKLSLELDDATRNASQLLTKVAITESSNEVLHLTNQGLRGELVETRQVVGKVQAETAAALDREAKAVAALKPISDDRDRWKGRTFKVGLAGIFLVIVAVVLAKLNIL